MASLLLSASLPTTACSSSPTHTRSDHQIPLQLSLRFPPINPSSRKSLRTRTRTLTISFALAESNSPKSLDDEDDALSFLQELSVSIQFLGLGFCFLLISVPNTAISFLQDSFRLPSDYFAQLPSDLRLDV